MIGLWNANGGRYATYRRLRIDRVYTYSVYFDSSFASVRSSHFVCRRLQAVAGVLADYWFVFVNFRHWNMTLLPQTYFVKVICFIEYLLLFNLHRTSVAVDCIHNGPSSATSKYVSYCVSIDLNTNACMWITIVMASREFCIEIRIWTRPSENISDSGISIHTALWLIPV